MKPERCQTMEELRERRANELAVKGGVMGLEAKGEAKGSILQSQASG